jgi:hypothetical protein
MNINFSFIANYSDGKPSESFGGDAALSYDNLNRENISHIEVLANDILLYTLHLEEGQQLIYRRRGLASTVALDKHPEPIIFLLGWKQKIGDTVVQSINYICYWVGRGYNMHQAGKFDNNHPWFYTPQLRIFEVEKGEEYYDPIAKEMKVK